MESTIFLYDDYRKYLSTLYKEKKEDTTYFSYEYIALKSGIKSRSYIYRIMKGERSLSISSCLKLCKALGLSEAEADYFFNLVCFNQASCEEERFFFNQKLNQIRNSSQLCCA